jgi:hypothetical protein
MKHVATDSQESHNAAARTRICLPRRFWLVGLLATVLVSNIAGMSAGLDLVR